MILEICHASVALDIEGEKLALSLFHYFLIVGKMWQIVQLRFNLL